MHLENWCSQHGRPAVTSSDGFGLGQRAGQLQRLVVPRGSIAAAHWVTRSPTLWGTADERRTLFPGKVCDVGQLEGHADDIWAACSPPAPPGPFLLRLQGVASRGSWGRVKPRQCPAAGPHRWTWLIRDARCSQKGSLSLKAPRRPLAGRGRAGPLRRGRGCWLRAALERLPGHRRRCQLPRGNKLFHWHRGARGACRAIGSCLTTPD